MKDESIIQQEIQLRGPKYACNLMRNNSGALKDKDGRLVRYGLGHTSKAQNDKIKSSDLIGFTRIEVTEEMVGQTVAIFTAVECKKESWNEEKKYDKREMAQYRFMKWIRRMGGYAGFANHVDKLKEILGK